MKIDAQYELHTGQTMPVMGLGTWQLTDDTAGAVSHALDTGYRMVDTSGDYGTQPGVGEAIRESAVARDDVYLVTKVEEFEDAFEATGENVEELGRPRRLHVDSPSSIHGGRSGPLEWSHRSQRRRSYG
jgi:2,5-diketo-D-gluconate reductase A